MRWIYSTDAIYEGWLAYLEAVSIFFQKLPGWLVNPFVNCSVYTLMQ